jgi:hypothetical protein
MLKQHMIQGKRDYLNNNPHLGFKNLLVVKSQFFAYHNKEQWHFKTPKSFQTY